MGELIRESPSYGLIYAPAAEATWQQGACSEPRRTPNSAQASTYNLGNPIV
jgi:hypothetical protein